LDTEICILSENDLSPLKTGCPLTLPFAGENNNQTKKRIMETKIETKKLA